MGISKKLPLGVAGLFLAVLTGLTAYYGLGFRWREPAAEEWRRYEGHLDHMEGELKLLAQRIHSLQGQGRCDHDDQCRVVGIGAKSCDRYNDFFIYSIKDTQEPGLLTVVDEFNDLHARMVDRALAVARCGQLPAPVICRVHRCRPDLPSP